MDTPLKPDFASRRVARLSLMAYFPNDDDARAALSRALIRFVDSEDHLDWLIERALDLYSRWPGIGELRALYCSRYRPKDGVEAYSEIYEQGFPHESKPTQHEPDAPGAPISKDAALDKTVREIAKGKKVSKG